MASNKQNRIALAQITRTRHYDWLGTPVSPNDRIQFHHAIKKCEHEFPTKQELHLGALLVETAHRTLHQREKNEKYYHAVNKLFLYLNATKAHPTIDYWEMQYELHKHYGYMDIALNIYFNFIEPHYAVPFKQEGRTHGNTKTYTNTNRRGSTL